MSHLGDDWMMMSMMRLILLPVHFLLTSFEVAGVQRVRTTIKTAVAD
jgi:hypothetical protein